MTDSSREPGSDSDSGPKQSGSSKQSAGRPKPTGGSPPLWRSVVDRVDGVVTPPANALVRTNAFADAIAAVTRLEVQLRRRVQRQTTWMLHLFNLPTASDQRRMRAQLAVIEARLRDLAQQLEDDELHRSRDGET